MSDDEACPAVCEEHNAQCERGVHQPEELHSHEYGIMICDFVAVD